VHWLRYRDNTSLSPCHRHHHDHDDQQQQQQQHYQLSPVTSSCVTSLSGDITMSYGDTKRPGKKATPVLYPVYTIAAGASDNDITTARVHLRTAIVGTDEFAIATVLV